MKKRTKKQTSDRVSAIAARVLSTLRPYRAQRRMLYTSDYTGVISYGELRALAASCLGQDETKGKRPK